MIIIIMLMMIVSVIGAERAVGSAGSRAAVSAAGGLPSAAVLLDPYSESLCMLT